MRDCRGRWGGPSRSREGPMISGKARTMGGRRKALTRILVVEDDAAVREVVADLLVFEGFAVQTARDEPESADRLARARYDLIVTDLFVPSSQAALDRVRDLQQQ